MTFKKLIEKFSSSFLFLIVSPFKEVCFAAVLSLFLISYNKGENILSLFSIYLISIFTISVVGGAIYRYNLKIRFSLQEIILLFIFPLLVVINLGVYIYQFGINFYEIYYLLFFFIYSYTAIITGDIIAQKKEKLLPLFIRYLEIFTFILTISCVLNVFYFYFKSELPTFFKGGLSYQMLSYYCAFAFGLNLFFLINRFSGKKLKFFSRKEIKVFRYILQVLLIICVVYTGGRGGFILMCVYGGFSLFLLIIDSKFLTRHQRVSIIISLIIIISLGSAFSYIMTQKNENMNRGSGRIMTIFDNSINTNDSEESIGREESKTLLVAGNVRQDIYKNSISLIKERPFTGYGMLHYMRILDYKQYPHNIFLEILLQGGIFFFIFFIGYMVYLLKKLLKMIKSDRQFSILMFIALFPLVQLMFSETYLTVSLFWLCISIIACYKVEKQ